MNGYPAGGWGAAVRRGQAGRYYESRKDYSADQRKQMAAKGHALSDGSYPIADTEDLKNAAILAKSGHGNVGAAKAHIRKRAKELGVSSPLDDKKESSDGSAGK